MYREYFEFYLAALYVTRGSDQEIYSIHPIGISVLMATHQWDRAARLADRAILLDGGRLVWEGPATDALAYEPREGARS